MKKLFIGTIVLTLLLTGCAQSESTASEAAVQPAAVQSNEEAKSETTSEEIMERIETSTLGESIPIPDNFPISYVPIIDGAQIIQGESKEEADKMIFNVTQSVNLAPEDAYRYYSDIYAEAPSYVVSNEKEGETMTIERAKNGLSAVIQFLADGEGKSKIIMEVILID
ncbi:MAG: hypothetical protein K0R69_1046 [Clostridia bacterium]|jgi:hypothetical protein|nr:hypothetical protein [Clostridia bacterium]